MVDLLFVLVNILITLRVVSIGFRLKSLQRTLLKTRMVYPEYGDIGLVKSKKELTRLLQEVTKYRTKLKAYYVLTITLVVGLLVINLY